MKNKHIISSKIIIITIMMMTVNISCEQDVIKNPKATIEINKDKLNINESLQIVFTGEADQVVIFTGDDMHNYDLRKESNTGFVVDKNVFTYSYATPGTYKVVCIASTYGDAAVNLQFDTCAVVITVIDDQTEIDRLSCPQILYDEVFAERLANDNWIMRLPRKVRYNNLTPSIALSQRLKFYVQSDSTQFFINGNAFESTKKYDLSSTVNIDVKSHFGTVRPYTLHTLYYPEFESFKMLGANGKLKRTEFDYSSFELEITLPNGTDVSHVIPEFKTYAATDKIYINDVEQISTVTAVDFTHNVTYKIVSFLAENSDIQAIGTVKIKIIYQ